MDIRFQVTNKFKAIAYTTFGLSIIDLMLYYVVPGNPIPLLIVAAMMLVVGMVYMMAKGFIYVRVRESHMEIREDGPLVPRYVSFKYDEVFTIVLVGSDLTIYVDKKSHVINLEEIEPREALLLVRELDKRCEVKSVITMKS